MLQNIKPAQLLRPVVTQNTYCQDITTWAPVADIQVFISVKSASPYTSFNVSTQKSTHIGITAHSDIRPQDIVEQDGKRYTVDAVAHARWTVLNLILEEELPHED
jgi:hypothetical protein